MSFLLMILACGGRPQRCETVAPGEAHDRCVLTAALGLPSNQVQSFYVSIQEIDDPMIRAGGIMHWVSKNNGDLQKTDGASLCGLLDLKDQALCLRKLDAIHLQR